ncbi:hypothetical protein RB595_000129 [Gaeumannomyces hyphopodioides]
MLPPSLRASAIPAIIVAAAALPLTFTGAWAHQQQQHVGNAPVAARSLGVPPAGNYAGALRPQVHFSAPQNFMNDPNGMFLDGQGLWHAYYQYNPTGLSAGNQHWGHATSRDLYHWENQPVALSPPRDRASFVFSGSVVTDPNNTSGFFPDRDSGVVAMFTLAERAEDGTPGPQTQALAYSLDGGYSFRHYDRNPVIDSDSGQFRDPKVIRHEDRWVMVLAYSQEFTVGIYSSPDLRHWTHESNFTRHGLLGAQWECPNLVQMQVRDGGTATRRRQAWVLVVSVQPGAPQGGSATQYFPGDFNGTHFSPWDGATRLADFAKDNYAAQYFYGLPEGSDAVSVGWASNWQYAERVPTGQLEGWRGGFTLPRVNYLAKAPRIGWVMVNEMHGGLAPVLGGSGSQQPSAPPPPPLDNCSFDGSGAAGPGGPGDGRTATLGQGASGSYYIEANVTGLDGSRLGPDAQLNFSLSSPSTGEALRWGMDFGGDMAFWIDRSGARALFEDDVFFTDKFSVADVWNSEPGAPAWRMQAVVDRSIFEVFVDGGIHAATVLIFPASLLNVFEVKVGGLSPDARVSIAVNGLESVWTR